jgi:hypothetical protein
MNYEKTEVSERELEGLTRKYTGKIEEGLVFVDHQRPTDGGRLDILMVDSGKALVVGELKVVEDDGMLLQGLDYYDYVSTHVETYSRLYKDHSIDPRQEVRLVLIAPSFSQTLVNRCKWLSPGISLFTFNCLKLDGQDEIIPVFSERSIPTTPPIIEIPPTQEEHLDYITDDAMRRKASAFMDEIKNWASGVTLDCIRYGVSIRINNKVFAYVTPLRKAFVIQTYSADDEWTKYPIQGDDDLANARTMARAAMERKMK